MELKIYHKKKESDSSTENKTITMTYPAFIKHIAIAGQGKGHTLRKFRRWLGMFLYYYDYLEYQDFNKGHFSHPKGTCYNPTEQSHFSNLAAIAIADFFAKKIDGTVYTDVYEAAMKKEDLASKGQRPDLIAYIPNQSKQFAIEAKGYTRKKVSDDEMKKIKAQAKAGGIPVAFSIACASYNLYEKVTCKYYDPPGDDNATFDEETFKALTKQYYKSFYDLK